LVDTQTIFSSPEHLTALGDWATFEFGTAGTSTTNGAEGGFARSNGDAKYGFYLGHANSRTASTVEQNPMDLFYASKAGDLAWGVDVHYSSNDNKTADLKEAATVVTAGFGSGPWDAGVNFRLTDSSDNAGTKTEASGMGLDGGYWFSETLYGFASYSATTVKDDRENTTIAFGVVNEEKVEGGKFFYGASYEMETDKNKATGGGKDESTTMPFIIGVEADAASWLVLRGSVTQNVLIGSEKNDFAGAGAKADSVANSTTVAAGAGLKFGKMTVDGTLAGETTGNINGTSLLSTASMTYVF